MRHSRRNGFLAGVSKKDFVAIADVLCTTGASDSTARALSSYFKAQNPGFLEDRFMSATRACKR